MTSASAIPASPFAQARFDTYRRGLLVAVTFLLPVSQVVETSGKKINFSFADLLLPLAFVLLAWRLLSQGLRFPVPMFFFLSICPRLARCSIV